VKTVYLILYVNFGINAAASITLLSLMFYMWKKGRMKFNLFTKVCMLYTSQSSSPSSDDDDDDDDDDSRVCLMHPPY